LTQISGAEPTLDRAKADLKRETGRLD
jgi:hypothetical protein